MLYKKFQILYSRQKRFLIDDKNGHWIKIISYWFLNYRNSSLMFFILGRQIRQIPDLSIYSLISAIKGQQAEKKFSKMDLVSLGLLNLCSPLPFPTLQKHSKPIVSMSLAYHCGISNSLRALTRFYIQPLGIHNPLKCVLKYKI